MGFNMSWILVDEIDRETLLTALDLALTGELSPEHKYDLGTTRVPLAGATFKSGWCAVFAHYALIMDATVGTDPPRLARLPASSRCITCVVLEHALVSYASLWQGGRHVWQIRHHRSHGAEHLEVSGDLPADFTPIRDLAAQKRRAEEEAIREEGRRPDEWGPNSPFDLPADYVFDVPLDVAATITGFHHTRAEGWELFTNLQALTPTSGNVLTKLNDPPSWWQTLRSIEYHREGDKPRERSKADIIREMKEVMAVLAQSKARQKR
jgi:hypothetical protein